MRAVNRLVEGVERLLDDGDYVKIIITESSFRYARVVGSPEEIHPVIINVGPLSAATLEGPGVGPARSLRELVLSSYELGFWKLKVIDDFLLTVKHPPAIDRYRTTHQDVAGPNPLSRDEISNFWTVHDQVPQVIGVNARFVTMNLARIVVQGVKYRIADVSEDEGKSLEREGRIKLVHVGGWG